MALARAVAARPRHLLLDEPLTNLDLDLKEHLLAWILNHARESGSTLLWVTHDPMEVEKVGGRCVRMEGGRISE